VIAVFRLGLLNPNTDERHTAAMRGVALDALPEGSKVIAVTAPRGPKAIESEVDSVLAAAEVIRMLESLPDMDAYLIACFGDPGLDAARELTSAPVVGIGEAAYEAAGLVSKKFAVVTTLPRGVAALEDAVTRSGLASRCVGVAPLHIPVSDQGTDHPGTTAAIIAVGQRLVDDGAEALVLACGGMADVAAAVQGAVRVPVCDGVSFGALLAFSLWRSGLRTSEIGAYASPEPVDYLDMPAPLASKGR
jgi:allantoin racemase